MNADFLPTYCSAFSFPLRVETRENDVRSWQNSAAFREDGFDEAMKLLASLREKFPAHHHRLVRLSYEVVA